MTNSDYQTAIHEAAHAVASHLQEFTLLRVKIEPSRHTGSFLQTHPGTKAEWALREMLVYRCGSSAERYILGVERISGNCHDESCITTLLSYLCPPLSATDPDELWDAHEEAIGLYRTRLDDDAKAFVTKYEGKIRRLADVLCTKHILSGEEAVAIIDSL